jgi:hypothetical protein
MTIKLAPSNQTSIKTIFWSKDDISNLKITLMKLVEENANLHSELKNVTVHEMLLALENEIDPLHAKTAKVAEPFLMPRLLETYQKCFVYF